jgi:hypothetical protein
MLLSAGIIFAVVYNDTGSRLRSQIDRDIAGDTAQAVRPGDVATGTDSRQIVKAIELYLGAQPYTATSTLLLAVVPGQGTATNHRELFGFAGATIVNPLPSSSVR